MGDFTGLLRQGFIVISAAVNGSRARLNWSSQRNSKRASTWRYREFARPDALSPGQRRGGNLIGDKPLLNIFFIRQTRCSFGVT